MRLKIVPRSGERQLQLVVDGITVHVPLRKLTEAQDGEVIFEAPLSCERKMQRLTVVDSPMVEEQA